MAPMRLLMAVFLIFLISLSAGYARFFRNVMRSSRAYGVAYDHDDIGNVKDYMIFSKRSLAEDSDESSVPRIVRVDDFGAKGNGKDDTSVRILNGLDYTILTYREFFFLVILMVVFY